MPKFPPKKMDFIQVENWDKSTKQSINQSIDWTSIDLCDFSVDGQEKN